MNPQAWPALVLAAGAVLLGGLTAGWQVRGLRRLRGRRHLASDERAYLRGKYRRRLVNGALLGVLGGLIAGAFLSGLEARADALAEPRPAGPDGEKPPMTPEQKALFRQWSLYWAGTVAVLLCVLGLAGLDLLANRRFWGKEMRRLREEHQAKLRRDLAAHRAQREQTRGGISGKRVDGGGDS